MKIKKKYLEIKKKFNKNKKKRFDANKKKRFNDLYNIFQSKFIYYKCNASPISFFVNYYIN
jgi:hypothetical protein